MQSVELFLKLVKSPTAQMTKPHTIAKSNLFAVTGVPVAGFVDETRVSLFGL
jgi:hypothetical protein